MEPIPETVQALRELMRYGDRTVARTLLEISRRVEEVVPQVVGLSLSLVADDLTFTLTAIAPTVAQPDGPTYLDGGPFDLTTRTDRPHDVRSGSPDDEERWQSFARATAHAGVESTLSLPLLRDDVVVAGINLYASTPDAFDGRHEVVAQACGGWPEGATTNADLGFSTRLAAAEAPERLRDESTVDRAIGAMMSRWDMTLDEAEGRLHDAAERAGVSDAQMARTLLDLLLAAGPRPEDGHDEGQDG